MIVGGKVTGNPNEIHNQEFFFVTPNAQTYLSQIFDTATVFFFICFLKFPRFLFFFKLFFGAFWRHALATNSLVFFFGEVKELETRSVEGSSQWMELMNALEV